MEDLLSLDTQRRHQMFTNTVNFDIWYITLPLENQVPILRAVSTAGR
jgi:hypothetical protein